MRTTNPILLLVLLSGLAAGPTTSPMVYARTDLSILDEPDSMAPDGQEKDTTWKEGAWALPPWPSDEDLVEFHIDDPASRFRQYIDGKHIEVGADGAVRYTLVVESASGVRNLSYEGLRCTPSGAYKTYAYGLEGRFETVASEWIPLRGRPQDRIHRALHRGILCAPLQFEPRPVKDMIRALRNRGFMTN